MGYRMKPHHPAILDAFDAGERSAAELGRRFSCSAPGVAHILRRHGRAPRSWAEARAAKSATLPPARILTAADLMGEVWKPVVGYEGRYEVSSLGGVRNRDGLILRPGLDTKGYEILSFRAGRRQKMVRVHRLACRAFHGEPPPGHEACHNDGSRRNNVETNLRWDTRSGNMRDAVRHGTRRPAIYAAAPRHKPHAAPHRITTGEARK